MVWMYVKSAEKTDPGGCGNKSAVLDIQASSCQSCPAPTSFLCDEGTIDKENGYMAFKPLQIPH